MSYIIPLLASTCNSLFFPNEPHLLFSASLKRDVLKICPGSTILSVNLEVPVEYVKSHIESHLKQCIPYAVKIESSLVLHFTVTSNTLVKICVL